MAHTPREAHLGAPPFPVLFIPIRVVNLGHLERAQVDELSSVAVEIGIV